VNNLNNNKLQITSIIIAGGKSTRFGEPKALSVYKGKMLIRYALDIGKQIANQTVIVYGETNYFKQFNITCIPDIVKNCGPLGGIYSALTHIKDGYVATIPCDTPFLDYRIYKLLIKNLKNCEPVIAMSNGGIEPLVGIWHKSAIKTVKQALISKQYRIINVLEKLNYKAIQIPTKEFGTNSFYNINTKSDLIKIERKSVVSR
jgi:molybdopterin-guanine dinucleotide biosynthesis protein A